MRRTPEETLQHTIQNGSGDVAVVWASDFGLRDWLVNAVERLASPSLTKVRVSDVASALQTAASLVLLIPTDEREVVLDLDASRDALLDAEGPSRTLVLFLVRGGDGERALAADAPSLRSWIASRSVDPDAIADEPEVASAEDERARFFESTGQSPSDWLRAWRSDSIERNAMNYARSVWASFLESGSEPLV
jgi:hypothetical protein